MVGNVRLKICGLTSARDAQTAVQAGADHLGFIFHPASPRALTLEKFEAFANELPAAKRVAVSVEPDAATLNRFKGAGFDFFQIHFRFGTPDAQIEAWSRAVTPARLWLAPKIPPAAALPTRLLPFAESFLLDTFDADKFGGTGKVGDWAKFARTRQMSRSKTWILSGGLSPENIVSGIKESGAQFVDVNSGVESSPGVKDQAKIAALVAAMRTLST
jgi:phosphoribosylanthranilate isomerase